MKKSHTLVSVQEVVAATLHPLTSQSSEILNRLLELPPLLVNGDPSQSLAFYQSLGRPYPWRIGVSAERTFDHTPS